MRIQYLLVKHTKKRTNFWAIVDCSGDEYTYKKYVYVWGQVGKASRFVEKYGGTLMNRRLRHNKYRCRYYDLSESDSQYALIQNDISKFLTIKKLSGEIE
jgi:hypothetical protein